VGSSSKSPGGSKLEKDQYVIDLRAAGTKWKEVRELYVKRFGRETTAEALQMRHKRALQRQEGGWSKSEVLLSSI
jgi:hypothetical protein